MNTHRLPLPILVAAMLLTAAGASAAVAARPVTVSPGSPDRLLEVGAVCPTFSWVADPAGGAYELRVYRVAEGRDGAELPAGAPAADEGGPAEAELTLRLRPPRGATSWTPPTAECLEPGGRYAWLVGNGGEGGQWSEARMFRVAPPAPSELERAVERVLARFVREGRLAPEGLLAVRALSDSESGPSTPGAAGDAEPAATLRQGPETRATTTGESAFMAELPTTSGAVTFGVKGVSHSSEGDSAGLLGYSDADSGKTYGVLGVTDSPGGRAVEGWASSDIGLTVGLSGIAESTGGSGVRGDATATEGATRGVRGTVHSAAGVGGLFQNLGGGPDLELGGSGTIFVDTSLFQLDFGGGGTFSVSGAGDVTAARFIGDGSLLTGIEDIGSGDIQDNAILTRHIKDGEILSEDIKDESLTAVDIDGFLNDVSQQNVSVGTDALPGSTTGFQNTGIGAESLQNNAAGDDNTAIGAHALRANTGGSNTAIGAHALEGNTTGGSNTALGATAGVFLTEGSNNIHIANMGVAGETDTIKIGTQQTQTRAFLAGVYGTSVSGSPVAVDSSGQLGVSLGFGTGDILNETILSEDILNETILSEDLGADSVDSSKIQAGAVRGSELGTIHAISVQCNGPCSDITLEQACDVVQSGLRPIFVDCMDVHGYTVISICGGGQCSARVVDELDQLGEYCDNVNGSWDATVFCLE